MTDKPKVEGWRVTRLSGNGYGRNRTIVDADIYNAQDPSFWVPGAMERHSIEPLIRLTDHEAARAADKARIAELTQALNSSRCTIYVVSETQSISPAALKMLRDEITIIDSALKPKP